ncbi:integrase core domain-containing protein [Phaeobacter sp. HS012]|nr:integrase core domain-containing protein [Phaeobacter sp. HS012]MBQ4881090.1 integrase core domain-containing protein [Phaeobacter sp. HS011]UWR43375.1 integrase core domain-containing protein [Phaeobacter inhibens]UWR47316.1 integrase core domain-containing protein [Phaeobacter inhibens]UWR55133.1 integrase core domain-containing protein [Phaeobacter inhibens]
MDEHLFARLRNGRNLTRAPCDDYNHHRPHSSFDGFTPREYNHGQERAKP